MKKTLLMLLMAGATLTAMAQSTREVKGAVIDKNGNPLSGAKVEATGGAESTVTDADGTFSLEVSNWLKSLTATYPGMGSKKKNIRNQNGDVIFEMYPQKKSWFVNVQGEYGIIEYEQGALGLMVGKVGGNWGYYGKIVYDFFEGKQNIMEGGAITFGAIKRIVPHFNWYLGAGPALGYEEHGRYVYNSYYKSSYHYYYHDKEGGIAAETGAMFNFGHFNANAGFDLRLPFDGDVGGGIHFGLGYIF